MYYIIFTMNRKMFNNKKCSNCSNLYDSEFYECPKCKTLNEIGNSKSRKLPTLYISSFNQSYLLGIGLILMTLITIFVSILVGIIFPDISTNKVGLIAIVTLITYILTLIFQIISIWEYKLYFLKTFLNYKAILVSILACIIIFGFDYLYNYIIETLYYKGATPEINMNQGLIIDMIKDSPILSFFTIVALGPIIEELTYRVGLFGLFRKFNVYIAYVVTILFFALAHISFEEIFKGNYIQELFALGNYLFASFILCITYHKFGFSASLIAHILNNLIAYSLILGVN